MPSNTTNANTVKMTLLAKKPPSRDTGESMAPGERRRSPRQAMSASDTTVMMPKKASNHGPTSPSAKACTLLMIPLRVRNVPRMVSANVATSKLMFHTRNMPRRSCTSTEWMYAVPVSHGRRLAFSTGSHAHTPLQPSTS